MRHVLTILVLSTLGVVTLHAQQAHNAARNEKASNSYAVLRNYEDSLSLLYNKVYQQNDVSALSTDFVETVLPYQSFRLFSPLTFYGGIAKGIFDLPSNAPDNQLQTQGTNYLGPSLQIRHFWVFISKDPNWF